MDKITAIVTGGTGGIGTAICQQLACEYKVVACYFKNGDHEAAKRWQMHQLADGYDIDILYGNAAAFDDCEKLTTLILEKYQQIGILVNNAGITLDVGLKKMSPTQWHQVIDANLTSVFNMTRNVLPTMLDNKYGRIITIASINGRKGQFGQCNYAASKAALFGFTKSLAQEVAPKGITVNTISPGYIATPMLSSMQEDTLNRIIAGIPVGRLGKPQEVANVVSFLASKAAGFITGANIDINGGQYM